MAFEDWEFQKRITATWYYVLQNCKYEILSQTLSRNNEKVLHVYSKSKLRNDETYMYKWHKLNYVVQRQNKSF